MWKCPKCGREFAAKEQSHYCEKPTTIDQYISIQSEEVQPILRQVRDAIRAAIPEAEERISWSMPTWWKGRNLIHFAAFKKHIGLYLGPEAVEAFSDRLCAYETRKGTVRLPYIHALPMDLIAEIAKWCYENNRGRQESWKSRQ